MLRKGLVALGAVAAVAVIAAALGLAWAHLGIRRERVPLPAREALATPATPAELPVRLSWINSASQAMPRGAVLDPSRDPSPGAPYVMSHPAFVLEWPDDRILLIDAGMTREGAAEFGKPIQWLSGGAAIEPLGSVAERLGAARERVRGAIFTHLHTDHVGGLTELCAGRDAPLPAFMSEAQDERPNFTTRPGRKLLREAGCVEVVRLSGEGALLVPGFPGVAVIRAGGHTPGSQMVVARVNADGAVRRFVFTGDAVNALDGVRHDVPKPLLYRLLAVPEDEERQGEVRRFLRELTEHEGFTPLVSHDQLEIERSGVPPWSKR